MFYWEFCLDNWFGRLCLLIIGIVQTIGHSDCPLLIEIVQRIDSGDRPLIGIVQTVDADDYL